MTKIGIYDSGIGGLTTLAKLIIKFQHCDFLFYSDNANFPLGTKNNSDVKKFVSKGIKKLEKECDYVVVACNTASSITDNKSVFKLLPPIDEYSPFSTMVLATPNTIETLKIKEKGYLSIDTPELATLITNMYLNDEEKEKALISIENLLSKKIAYLPTPKNILIGCSHYMFIEESIKKICKQAQVHDGNYKIISELEKEIPFSTDIGTVDFEFSGEKQFEKYMIILEMLLNAYHKKQDLLPRQ